MKAIIFSDLHGHNFREFSEMNDGINSRFDEQLTCVDRIITDAKENKADAVLFLGDATHLKNFIDTQIIKMTMAKFREIADVAPLIICPGNHDFRAWGSDPILLEMLHEFAPEVQMDSLIDIGGWIVHVFPFVRNIDLLDEKLKGIVKTEKSIGLFHQDLAGQYYGGFKVEKGLDPDVLSAKFRWSFVGHFHESKLVRPTVISVGSPLQLSFGEMTHEVGWWLLDTETEPMLRFIKNEKSPEFLEMTLEAGQKVDFADDNNYYRIKVKGMQAPEGIAQLKWHRLSFEGVREGLSHERSEIKFSDSIEALIEKYILARNVNNLDEGLLKTLGRKYLR